MAPAPGPVPGTVGQPGAELQDSSFLMATRKSMTVSTKGLLNMPGQNNCFLNSAVQVLWHLDAFRRSFRELSGHACMAESCIFCALKELFTQFQYSQESALPPDALRHALAKTFCDQRRFQLGFMDDAAECFENILLRIHVHITNQEGDDMCGNTNCIPHQKFAMTLVEQRICHNCGAVSEPLPFNQMVHYVTTSALCAKSMGPQQEMKSTTFGKFLRLAGDIGEVRDCPGGCGAQVQVQKTLMNHPEVVSIGLVWDSECPTLQHITDVFHSIGMCLRLQDMFHYVFDIEWAGATTHQLVGVVTYYGKHYSTFFFHTKLRVWIYFDDATVQEVGPSWEQVVEKCQRGRFQPLLLLFANPDSCVTPVRKDYPVLDVCSSSDITNKSSPMFNQRQAVIRQYLMLQNSLSNINLKPQYDTMRNGDINSNAHEAYSFNSYQGTDHKISSQNFESSMNSTFSYNRSTVNNQPLPVYSNLQYLNALQTKQHVDLSKLNEVSLPSITQLQSSCSKTNSHSVDSQVYDSLNALEMHNRDKKDFDGAKDSDSAFTEEDQENSDMYISRKAVENVLNLQKRQMSLSRSYSQSSVGNRNSSSSLESFDNVHTNKLNPMKNVSAEVGPNRRDSGSWSSDRNSSSSNNSVENPFLTVIASKRLLLGLNKKSQLPDFSNTNTSDHGYDSYSVSSSDSYPSVNGSPVKLDPRLTQIPEDWQPEEDTDLDKKLKLVTEDASGPPDCDKLCAEADLLLAKSHEKEKDGDLVMAALLSDSAAARARAAMEAPYNNSRSLVSAKMKHSTCVMRSSNLYRRLKDHETDERRKQKAHTGHHSRQSSRDSTHSKHSRQGSKDSTHSKSGSKDSNPNSDDADNFVKNIEIYGTLPKKGSRKKTSVASGSLKVKDDQVYKDFLDKQRKNTSLSNALNETMLKNVDLAQNRSDNSPKAKGQQASSEKSHRKSFPEGIPPKSPTRKKDSSPRSETDSWRKPHATEQSFPAISQEIKNNSTVIGNKDLCSPVTSADKKQHKIKRKLMGGFLKRKNRSLPDLREDLTGSVDHFLDDAIIQVPSVIMLPNQKSKKKDNQTNAGMGNMMRGFHQPHHAFVKKDLTQRPLLMKVDPPNIQPSIMSSPKSKLIHTLPSLPKKLQGNKDSHFTTSTKPSKIPFMSTLPKNDLSNLPPLPAFKPNEIKSSLKTGLPHKISAIPVPTPQVSLSPLKACNNVKEDSELVSNQTPLTEQSNNDEPPTFNPFLAEIQAKRNQVMNKSLQKKETVEITKSQDIIAQLSENKELSMLPKLALQAEGTSWLKELQRKQQQILNKQDNNMTGPSKAAELAEKPNHTKASETLMEPDKTEVKSWKILSENGLEIKTTNTHTESNVNTKVSNSVKDLASRFEKVLKKPKVIPTLSSLNGEHSNTLCNEKKQNIPNVQKEIPRDITNMSIQEQLSSTSSFANTTTRIGVSLKPALKVRSESNIDGRNDSQFKHTIADTSSFLENSLKQGGINKSTDLHINGITNSNGLSSRPMQPPDYTTAMQRLERFRTTISETNFQQPEQDKQCPVQILDSPKKKQGPKKSVTFSDEVVLVACAEYEEIDFSSNPLFERVYQQHMEAGKGEIPILSNSFGSSQPTEKSRPEDSMDRNSNGPSPCNLCHSKHVNPPNIYCTDCEFYLSRFKA